MNQSENSKRRNCSVREVKAAAEATSIGGAVGGKGQGTGVARAVRVGDIAAIEV
jgi:hypothetical protein